MEIHIGELLSAYFKKKRTRRAALSRLMNVDLRTVMLDQKKQTVQLKRLLEYCIHLQHNFIMDVALQLPKEYTTTIDPFAESNIRIAQLEADLKQVTSERDLLARLLQK